MKIFWTTILIGILGTATFVFIMDPGYRWHDAPVPFFRDLKEDEIRIFPTNFDERSIKVSHINFIEKPDVLLLGSSRMAPVSSIFFKKDLKIFNAGLSSASFEDYIAIWQDMKQLGKNPKKVIIFMDPWLFNSTANNKATGWHFIGKYVENFYSDHGYKGQEDSKGGFKGSGTKLSLKERTLKISRSAMKTPERLSRGFDLAFQIVSWPMVKQAVKIFIKNGISRDRMINLIINRTDFGPEDRGVAKDGATLYPLSERRAKTPSELRALVMDTFLNPNAFDEWHFDQEAKVKFDLLLNDISQSGTEVLMIAPPLHPLMTELLSHKINYVGLLNEVNETIRSQASKTPAVVFCDAENFEKVGCQESEMKDATHLLEGCISKVLRYCTQNTSWSKLL